MKHATLTNHMRTGAVPHIEYDMGYADGRIGYCITEEDHLIIARIYGGDPEFNPRGVAPTGWHPCPICDHIQPSKSPPREEEGADDDDE